MTNFRVFTATAALLCLTCLNVSTASADGDRAVLDGAKAMAMTVAEVALAIMLVAVGRPVARRNSAMISRPE